MTKNSVKRLIDWFVPNNYYLAISQDSSELTFNGTVTILGRLTDTALKDQKMFLHSSDLKIISITLDNQVCSFEINEKTQEISIDLSNLPSQYLNNSGGDIQIAAEFSGTITRPMHGIYPCFFNHEGKEKRLLATQFESHHAREVFPCVDEPEAKAIFELSISCDANDTVLSNTPIASEKIHENGLIKTTIFEPTPKMSTYLLAWVSGELIFFESTSTHGVKVRTYSTPVHKGKLEFATEVLCRAMDFLDDYFNIPYPLPKFDQIALPDFAAGAMENWGCVTFRESALLYDPKQSDLNDKQYVAEVVIHELAHQWFGNLVTMRWWNDLWLNEGFASWIPYLVRDELFPEWKVWDHFATSDLAIGLRADSLINTHPIVVEIENPDEIRSAFDSISYDKGCSVINLLYNYIGPVAFRDGLRTYLKKHAYSNAETYDLWHAWSESSKKDVGKFMQQWTETPGFPIIQVKDDLISQNRFLLESSDYKDKTVWPIPLMRSDSDTEILDDSSKILNVNEKLNKGQSGFYRVIYDGKISNSLKEKLANGTLDPADSIGLVADASESAKAGYHSTVKALEMIYDTRKSVHEQLVNASLSELAEIRTVLSDTYEAQKKYLAKYIDFNLTRLGINKLPDEPIDDELLRPSILGAASFTGNKEIVAWLLRCFDIAEMAEDLPAELRGIIYQTAVREYNNKPTHDKLMKWYSTTTIPGERTTLAASLSSFRDESLASFSLSLINTDRIKLQDSLYWVAYGLRNRWNKQLAWEWVKNNWDWVATNFSKEKEIDYYLRYCASGFATNDHLKDYITFFSNTDIFGSKRAFLQGQETIRWQTAWKERDNQVVTDWLTNFTDIS